MAAPMSLAEYVNIDILRGEGILRTALLSIHAASGALGLIVGLYAIRPPETDLFRVWPRRTYSALVVVMTVSLVAVVVFDWTSIQATQQIVFGGLVVLAAVIVYRVLHAVRLAHRRSQGWQRAYINDIYFSYISLWEAFFIVLLIDVGAPLVVTAGVAVGVALLGALLIARYKRQLARQSPVEVEA